MLGVAQLGERQAVDLLVGGSNPLAQPIFSSVKRVGCMKTIDINQIIVSKYSIDNQLLHNMLYFYFKNVEHDYFNATDDLQKADFAIVERVEKKKKDIISYYVGDTHKGYVDWYLYFPSTLFEVLDDLRKNDGFLCLRIWNMKSF